jgi:hypothetical protein
MKPKKVAETISDLQIHEDKPLSQETQEHGEYPVLLIILFISNIQSAILVYKEIIIHINFLSYMRYATNWKMV